MADSGQFLVGDFPPYSLPPAHSFIGSCESLGSGTVDSIERHLPVLLVRLWRHYLRRISDIWFICRSRPRQYQWVSWMVTHSGLSPKRVACGRRNFGPCPVCCGDRKFTTGESLRIHLP